MSGAARELSCGGAPGATDELAAGVEAGWEGGASGAAVVVAAPAAAATATVCAASAASSIFLYSKACATQRLTSSGDAPILRARSARASGVRAFMRRSFSFSMPTAFSASRAMPSMSLNLYFLAAAASPPAAGAGAGAASAFAACSALRMAWAWSTQRLTSSSARPVLDAMSARPSGVLPIMRRSISFSMPIAFSFSPASGLSPSI